MRQKEKDKIGGLIVKKRRSFNKEFKREIVETVVSDQASAAELSREYHISPILISKFKERLQGRKVL